MLPGRFDHAEADVDINYSVLALVMLEAHGADLTTEDLARGWLRHLPGGIVFTAERRALITLLEKSTYGFPAGAPAGFDLAECSDNEFNDWIGAQIRADFYGWANSGRPERAAALARRDTELSHRAEGVYGAMAVAAIGAAIPAADDLFDADGAGLRAIPDASDCAEAMRLGVALARVGDGPGEIHNRYRDLSPVHTVNNLALVVWGCSTAPMISPPRSVTPSPLVGTRTATGPPWAPSGAHRPRSPAAVDRAVERSDRDRPGRHGRTPPRRPGGADRRRHRTDGLRAGDAGRQGQAPGLLVVEADEVGHLGGVDPTGNHLVG